MLPRPEGNQGPLWGPFGGEGDGMKEYRALVRSIPEVLPNLQYLFLSLEGAPELVPGDIPTGDERIVEAAERLLEPVDELVRKIGFRDCRIALPSSLWIVLGGTSVKLDSQMVKRRSVLERSHRPLDCLLEREAVRRLLPAVGGLPSGAYWLCHGQQDMKSSFLSGRRRASD